MDHFSKVRDLIWDARSSYENLGYGLGLSPASVDTIKQSNHSDVEKCFDRILEEVLKRELSRNKLAEVLESRHLGYRLLAKKVREKEYGKLFCIATCSLCEIHFIKVGPECPTRIELLIQQLVSVMLTCFFTIVCCLSMASWIISLFNGYLD